MTVKNSQFKNKIQNKKQRNTMSKIKWKMHYFSSVEIHQNSKGKLWQLSSALKVLYCHLSPRCLLCYAFFKDYWHISHTGVGQANDKHILVFFFIIHVLSMRLDPAGGLINSKLLIQRKIILLLVWVKHWVCLPEMHGTMSCAAAAGFLQFT